jgi:hypothetical protein
VNFTKVPLVQLKPAVGDRAIQARLVFRYEEKLSKKFPSERFTRSDFLRYSTILRDLALF